MMRAFADIAGVCAWCCAAAGSAPPPDHVTLRPYLMTGQTLPGSGEILEINSLDCSSGCSTAIRVKARDPADGAVRDFLVVADGAAREVVAAGGLAAPDGFVFGTGASDAFDLFQAGDAAGRYSFTAELSAPDGQYAGRGVISSAYGEPRLLLRTMAPAPDLPGGASVRTLWRMTADGRGRPAILAGIASGGPAIYIERPEGARLLVLDGEPAPGVAGATIGIGPYKLPLVTDDGCVFFVASLSTGGNALFRATLRGNAVPIAVTGWPVGGAEEGVTYSEISPQTNIAAALGRAAFVATLSGRGVTADNDLALVSGPISGPELRVRKGQSAGEPGGGVVFASFEHLALNDAGTLVFEGRLRGPDVDSDNDSAIWRLGEGALRLLAREGGWVPGADEDLRFGQLARAPFESMFLNARGDAVFEAGLRGADGSARGRGLFAAAAGQNPVLLVRTGQEIVAEGETLSVAQIDTRRITAIESDAGNSTGGADGQRTVLTPHGEVFVLLRFTGGRSGVFRAQVGVRPCPADFNRDDFVDCFDYFDFIEAFEAGRPEADVNEDEFLDFQDFNTFIGAFEEGC